jgi:PAS domain S-box-containing protein
MDLFEQKLQKWIDEVGISNLLQFISDVIPDAAIFVIDRDREILMWNKQAENLLGHTAQEILGQHCRKANRCYECMIGCAFDSHEYIHNKPLTMHHRDGSTIRVRKMAHSFRDSSGNFIGGIELLYPVTTERESRKVETLDFTQATNTEPMLPIFKQFDKNEVERLGEMVSRNAKMKQIFRLIRNISETDATVLIHGASGTGKELVARAIHATSLRRNGPFVAVNCSALTPTLLESELFGHAKGAFTGAVTKRIGLFQRAERGTIFLDEIAEIPLDLQAKLLRVLEAREILPVGSSTPVKVDIRVISATHRSLRNEVKLNNFREDLMYRLHVVPINLPPLRERLDDLQLLIWHFISKFNEYGPRYISVIDPKAMRLLFEYPWSGNVRELKNAIEHAFAVGRGHTIMPEELPFEIQEYPIVIHPHATQTKITTSLRSSNSTRLKDSNSREPSIHEDLERQRLKDAIEQSVGNIGKAADMLGISRPTFWRKRKKYGV